MAQNWYFLSEFFLQVKTKSSTKLSLVVLKTAVGNGTKNNWRVVRAQIKIFLRTLDSSFSTPIYTNNHQYLC